jgi:hypothetical protein
VIRNQEGFGGDYILNPCAPGPPIELTPFRTSAPARSMADDLRAVKDPFLFFDDSRGDDGGDDGDVVDVDGDLGEGGNATLLSTLDIAPGDNDIVGGDSRVTLSDSLRNGEGKQGGMQGETSGVRSPV